MKCKICSSLTEKAFSKRILGKYEVGYFKCLNCAFLQTEEPFWLEEAYSDGAISALDTGIMRRNLLLRGRIQEILLDLFSDFTNFSALDYGGGEGIFVRMMRDLGFNFYRQDRYANNLYSRFFDVADVPEGRRFNILTAFEVFEHLPEPLEEIKVMFSYSDIILFSTILQPSEDIQLLENWWYIGRETGQHVSFYTKDSFENLADSIGAFYYSNSRDLHILSKRELSKDPFLVERKRLVKKTFLQKLIHELNIKYNPHYYPNRKGRGVTSLTNNDYELIKQKNDKR